MPRKSLDALGAPQPERGGRTKGEARHPAPEPHGGEWPRQGRRRHLANTIKATAV
jgi:hypothetical protein